MQVDASATVAGENPAAAALALAESAWNAGDFAALAGHARAASSAARVAGDAALEHRASYMLGHAERARLNLGAARVAFVRVLHLVESVPTIRDERPRAHHDLFATLAMAGSHAAADRHHGYAERSYSVDDPFRLALQADRAFFMLHAGQHAEAARALRYVWGTLDPSAPFFRAVDGAFAAALALNGDSEAARALDRVRERLAADAGAGWDSYYAATASAALGRQRDAQQLAATARRIGRETDDALLHRVARALSFRLSGPR